MSQIACSNINISVALGFVAVPNPRAAYGRTVILKARDNAAFQVSNTSDGGSYFTTVASLPLALSVLPDGSAGGSPTLCYVKGTSTTVLEMILT